MIFKLFDTKIDHGTKKFDTTKRVSQKKFSTPKWVLKKNPDTKIIFANEKFSTQLFDSKIDFSKIHYD